MLWQLKPSILTGVELFPNFTRMQPPPVTRPEEEKGGGGERAADSGIGSIDTKLSLPKLTSLIRGFEALLGGDPQKNGESN